MFRFPLKPSSGSSYVVLR